MHNLEIERLKSEIAQHQLEKSQSEQRCTTLTATLTQKLATAKRSSDDALRSLENKHEAALDDARRNEAKRVSELIASQEHIAELYNSLATARRDAEDICKEMKEMHEEEMRVMREEADRIRLEMEERHAATIASLMGEHAGCDEDDGSVAAGSGCGIDEQLSIGSDHHAMIDDKKVIAQMMKDVRVQQQQQQSKCFLCF